MDPNGKITKLNSGTADIEFDDFILRIFVKYRNQRPNQLRIWKLPKRFPWFAMFNTNNLIWAIYGDDVSTLHGWFFKEGKLIEVLSQKLEKKSSYQGIKEFLKQCETILSGRYPNEDI